MVSVERVFFEVPKNEGNDDIIKLEGLVLQPHGQANGKVVFAQGFPGSFDFYYNFLQVLAEEFTVITYYSRGLGSSEGKFNSQGGGDLASIVRAVKGSNEKVALIGNSLGTAFCIQAVAESEGAISSVYLINPFLGNKFLPGIKRYGPLLLYLLSSAGVATVAEKATKLISQPKQQLYQHNIDFGRKVAELARLRVPQGLDDVPTAFTLADCDQVLGTTNNANRYDYLVGIIQGVIPSAKDFSRAVRGLNHFLTYPGEGGPFGGRANGAFMDSVVRFTTDNLVTERQISK